MQNILVTGAAGHVGSRLRNLLKGTYPRLVFSDIRTPADLSSNEEFLAADLADYAQVEKIVAGVDGIVHLGGYSIDGDWPTILNANIIGCLTAVRPHGDVDADLLLAWIKTDCVIGGGEHHALHAGAVGGLEQIVTA